MENREEFDLLVHEFLTGDSESLKTVALELTAIDKAFTAGEIDESMRTELLDDVSELVRVETKVEKALALLSNLTLLI